MALSVKPCKESGSCLSLTTSAKKEGIFAGTSSGAAFAAAVKLTGKVEGKHIITVFPDRGDRYFSAHLYDGNK